MTLLHWLGEDCHESFTSHFSRSDSLLHPSPVVFLFSHSFSCWPRSYLWVCPLCSEAAHGGANDAFLNPASAFCWSFLCHLSFFVYHVLKVSVLLERISASYQRETLMPTSLLCLPAANYHLDQGGFLTASCESPEKDCKTKAELKLNSNEGPKKGHCGI